LFKDASSSIERDREMIRMKREIKKSVRLLIPDKTNDGKFLEEIAGALLKGQRYRIVERVRFTGMEIDLIADNVDTNQRVFVECKFVQESHPLSANVIDIIIGHAVRKNIKTAYLFSTAPLGKEAKGVMDELKQENNELSPKIAFVGPENIADMFVDIYNAEPHIPEASKALSIASATLILTPQFSPFWVLEEYQNGIPQRAFLQTVSNSADLEIEEISRLFKEHKIYQGLELVYTDLSSGANHIETSEREEIVTRIPVADSLDDYRPCKPEYFIGRIDTQKKIWDFLRLVRQNRTSTRILALSGPSGFGKSSVVLKLADRFRNKKWINKLYLYPIDVRSAKGPLFVAKALKTALQTAVEDGFIPNPPMNITIESTESFLQSESVQMALDSLQNNKRVLVVFFDQFEELFTKEELLPTFEAFKKLAFEVHSAQANLVIGFSWRTGITLSDDNPAYHMWHDLKDLRKDIVLGEFTSAESSELLSQFERELSEKLLPPLRRRLLEQGQGLPWLLKKLSIHIYREIKDQNTKQEDLLSRRLNIELLFKEDLTPLTNLQIQCLKYIAKNSPVDVSDVFDHFDQIIVNQLYDRRLIVRAGQKYAVYWDIFRDYLVDETIPAIPWTYVPQSPFSATIHAFDILKEGGPLGLTDLANELDYKESTVMNIITDLQNLLLSNRDESGMYHIRSELCDADWLEVARFLVGQMREHIVTQSIYDRIGPGERLSKDGFKQVIADSYVAANLGQDTINAYLNRLLPWLRFVGLLNYSEFEDCIIRPQGIGEEVGKVEFKRRSGKNIQNSQVFIISSTPQKAVELAKDLIKYGRINRDKVLELRNRNAASDLRCLDLAQWDGEYLVPLNEFANTSLKSEETIKGVIAHRALNNEFLRIVGMILKSSPSASGLEIGTTVAKRINRNWSRSSAIRYGNAGLRWNRTLSEWKSQKS